MKRMRTYSRDDCALRACTAEATSFSKERMKVMLVIPDVSSKKGRAGSSRRSRQQDLTTRSRDLSLDTDVWFTDFVIPLKKQWQTLPVNVSDSSRGAISPSNWHRCGGFNSSPGQR